MESVLKLARQVCFFLSFFFQECHFTFTNVYFSISLRLGSHNETNSLQDNCLSTETLCPRSRVHITLLDGPPTQTFWMTNIFTMFPLPTLSVSKNTTKLKTSMWSGYDKSLKISFWSWVLRLSLDVRIRIYFFTSPSLNIVNNQSSRRQWSGLQLVSLPHQRVISKVDILPNFLIFINKSNVCTY